METINRNWRLTVIQFLQMTLAVVIGSFGVIVFFAPFDIAPGGVSGIAVMLNHLIDTPIGLVIFILNIPIQILAYKMLPDGWRVISRTLYILVIYSLTLDIMARYLPTQSVSDDVLLNAVFGGVLEGISGGLAFRSGGTFGGTSTLAIILRRKWGMPMSATLLYTDTLVIGAAGLVYGWEAAMYAILALFLSGLATDYMLEGPSVIRTAVIITNMPDAVSGAIMTRMGRGVTAWDATGMYTKQARCVLYVTVSRSEVTELRQIVTTIDPGSFLVIGQGHTAYGEGFTRPVK